MKSQTTRAILILLAVLLLYTNANADKLNGPIDSKSRPGWQASWMNLEPPINFKKGERLRLMFQGTAKNMVVRLLPQGALPDTSTGIVGGVRTAPENKTLEVILPEDRPSVVQISIHAGPKAWDIELGPKNGHATLTGIDRVAR